MIRPIDVSKADLQYSKGLGVVFRRHEQYFFEKYQM